MVDESGTPVVDGVVDGAFWRRSLARGVDVAAPTLPFLPCFGGNPRSSLDHTMTALSGVTFLLGALSWRWIRSEGSLGRVDVCVLFAKRRYLYVFGSGFPHKLDQSFSCSMNLAVMLTLKN